MSRRAFEKIAEGAREAIAIARGESEPVKREAKTVPRTTTFIAQPFVRKGRKLAAGPQAKTATAEEAISRARRMAERNPGAIAFSITGDAEFDDYDEPVILGKFGELPPELAE